MVGSLLRSRAEPGFTLPAFERLAPPPPPAIAAARLEANSAPGDIVVDLHGRGGWIARAAIDHRRRGVSLEASPLNRLLAELVLRPPDLRHLDAAFSGLGASPHGETSVRLAIADLFATTCATCGRSVVAEAVEWSGDEPRRVHYRCTVCRDQQGGHEHRAAPASDADRALATADVGGAALRHRLRHRFPVPDGGAPLVEALLGLHTDRQLIALAAILERVEGDLRAAPVESALRVAFLHTVLPASRLGGTAARPPALRIAGGAIRSAVPDPWHERNPWLVFEEAFRMVRAFVQRLEASALGPLEARLGADLRSLAEGTATAVVRVMSPAALEALAAEAGQWREVAGGAQQAGLGRDAPARSAARPRVRLVLSQPPARLNQERLGAAYVGTCWALGREAAALLPLEPLLGPAIRMPWSWQAGALRRSLAAVAPHLARDGRVVLLLEQGGPEALVAAAVGGAAAGYRLVDARLAEPDEEIGGVVELVPPGATLPPGPRTRANRPLKADAGSRGDPELVPGPGLFAPPERIDARPFSPLEAARTIQDTAVEVLRARGEPASRGRLLGEVLVGLDRSGQLARLLASGLVAQLERAEIDEHRPQPVDGAAARAAGDDRSGAGREPAVRARPRTFSREPVAGDPVERVLALVDGELTRTTQRRLVEVEPGRWWLADRRDRETAAVPLADRVEWAVFSLLSTAGPIAEGAFFERIAALFSGPDLPDEALVRACVESYRAPGSTGDRLLTADDLRRRTAEHSGILAHLANGGHRLGMNVWLGRREQARRVGDRLLAEYLDAREREPWLPTLSRVAQEDVEAIDCIWYARGSVAFAFEVEWTAMLGEVVLRRHGRIAPDDRLVRFLAVPPERRELVRFKIASSPLLRDAIEASNWHLVLWPHLLAWLGAERPDLDALEPYLGLDPAVERLGQQLGLFEPPDSVR